MDSKSLQTAAQREYNIPKHLLLTSKHSDSALKKPTQQDGVTDTTPHKPHIPVKPEYITE
jgi:hypothetical protein